MIQLALLVVFGLAGLACRPPPSATELVAARFCDENHDGVPQPSESILLTFSAPIQIDGGPASTGILLHPPQQTQLASYRTGPGESETQLRVVLGLGTPDFRASGIYGEGSSAVGVSIDFDRIAVKDENGRLLRGRSSVVDLALSVPSPALLLSADWVDQDRNHAVTEGDEIELTFDRPVLLSDAIKLAGRQAPPGLFQLPIRSDRLDDGERTARLRATDEEAIVWLILGSRPRLTLPGEFDHRLLNQQDAASGIAIQGTRIRANEAIRDRFGVGVASREFIDIGTIEPCEPFTDIGPNGSGPPQTELHTATRLPDGESVQPDGQVSPRDGRVVVIGGLVEETRPSSDIWTYEGDGSWRQEPQALKQARYGHTATYFVGDDGTPQTSDDFILVAGGCDGHKALRDLEVVLPYAPGGLQVLPVYDGDYAQHLTPRFYHTAHGFLDRLVLVGGQSSTVELNARVEELEVRVSWPSQQAEPHVSARAQKLGTLQYAREFHESCLLQFGGEQFVFVYGGWGTSNLRGHDQVELPPLLVNPGDNILGQPELFSLHGQVSIILAKRESSDEAPAPRRSHRIVNLAPSAERPEFLLLGGTQASPFPVRGAATPPRECRSAYRFRVSFDEKPPTIEWKAVGSLAAERHSMATILLSSGDVLVAGGAEDGAPSNRVELFDSAHDDFAPFCANLLSPREGAQVAPTSGEGWLLIGGRGATDTVCERFDTP